MTKTEMLMAKSMGAGRSLKRKDKMNDDQISRQAAIDALDEQIKFCDNALCDFNISLKDEYAVKVERASLCAYKEILEDLPPAQPQIIRCKVCKWFGDIGCAIEVIDDSDRPTETDFCSFAERRTDEDD